MTSELIRLILFARYPVAGQAKTRLIPALGSIGAAKVHKLLAQKTLATISNAIKDDKNIELILSYTGAPLSDFQQWLKYFINDQIRYLPQPDGDLTDRLMAMIAPAPVIFFGSDTPDLTQDDVKNAIAALQKYDVVIGPALDGGYYLIGMNDPHDMLLRDMPWSSDQVLPITLSRCKEAGLSVHMLEPLSDCDMPEDLARWPWIYNAMDDTIL